MVKIAGGILLAVGVLALLALLGWVFYQAGSDEFEKRKDDRKSPATFPQPGRFF